MSGTRVRGAALVALSVAALVACGGGSATSPTGGGGDDALLLASSKDVSVETSTGDGICDGCDGTCDGTGQGPGPHGPHAGNGTGQGTCDGTGQGPGPQSGNGPGEGTCDGTCTCAETGPDPQDLAAVLVNALQEEYLALWTYRRVLADLGDEAMPFSVIAVSEEQHVQTIVGLFQKRDWAAPSSVWTVDNVGAFGSLPAACAGGVGVELEDIELYDALLARDDLPCDTVTVFTNLRAASQENHLPAFERCR